MRGMLKLSVALATVGGTFFFAREAPAATSYELTELPTLPGYVNAYAMGLSQDNKVVGCLERADGVDHTVFWDNTPEHAVHLAHVGPLNVSSCGSDIADNGSRVGLRYGPGIPLYQGFLGPTPMPQALQASNNIGRYAGFMLQGPFAHPFIAGMFAALPQGFQHAIIFDITDGNIAVGYTQHYLGSNAPARAVRWVNGVPQLLASSGANHFDAAFGVNGSGVVVGRAGPIGNEHAARWENGALVDLGSFGGRSGATDINAAGTIVGWSYHANGDIDAFVTTGAGVAALNTLVHRSHGKTAQADVFDLQDAMAINNAGFICGYGRHSNATRAFLLTPKEGPAINHVTIDELRAFLGGTRQRVAEVDRKLAPVLRHPSLKNQPPPPPPIPTTRTTE